jgi:hypothetical protein
MHSARETRAESSSNCMAATKLNVVQILTGMMSSLAIRSRVQKTAFRLGSQACQNTTARLAPMPCGKDGWLGKLTCCLLRKARARDRPIIICISKSEADEIGLPCEACPSDAYNPSSLACLVSQLGPMIATMDKHRGSHTTPLMHITPLMYTKCVACGARSRD